MAKSGGFHNEGPFTPFLYKAPDAPPKSSIQFPGGTGGVNWGGVAIDPTTGFIFAASHDNALVGWVQDKDPNVTYSFEAVGSKQPYDRASINGVGPFFTFSAPLGGKYDDERPPGGSERAVSTPAVGQARRSERRARARSHGSRRSDSTSNCPRANSSRATPAARDRRSRPAASCSSAPRATNASAPSTRRPARSSGARRSGTTRMRIR